MQSCTFPQPRSLRSGICHSGQSGMPSKSRAYLPRKVSLRSVFSSRSCRPPQKTTLILYHAARQDVNHRRRHLPAFLQNPDCRPSKNTPAGKKPHPEKSFGGYFEAAKRNCFQKRGHLDLSVFSAQFLPIGKAYAIIKQKSTETCGQLRSDPGSASGPGSIPPAHPDFHGIPQRAGKSVTEDAFRAAECRSTLTLTSLPPRLRTAGTARCRQVRPLRTVPRFAQCN